jgi:hypothetical protein
MPAGTKQLLKRNLLKKNHFRTIRSKLNRRPEFKPPTSATKLMRNLRTYSVGTKLTDKEFATVLAACPEPTLSKWILRVLLAAARSQPVDQLILAELASLQRLPQLHTAITENRKSNNPAVLRFQGRSQIETRYGHAAEAILSQPATKIFVRTTEPRAAKSRPTRRATRTRVTLSHAPHTASRRSIAASSQPWTC